MPDPIVIHHNRLAAACKTHITLSFFMPFCYMHACRQAVWHPRDIHVIRCNALSFVSTWSCTSQGGSIWLSVLSFPSRMSSCCFPTMWCCVRSKRFLKTACTRNKSTFIWSQYEFVALSMHAQRPIQLFHQALHQCSCLVHQGRCIKHFHSWSVRYFVPIFLWQMRNMWIFQEV